MDTHIRFQEVERCSRTDTRPRGRPLVPKPILQVVDHLREVAQHGLNAAEAAAATDTPAKPAAAAAQGGAQQQQLQHLHITTNRENHTPKSTPGATLQLPCRASCISLISRRYSSLISSSVLSTSSRYGVGSQSGVRLRPFLNTDANRCPAFVPDRLATCLCARRTRASTMSSRTHQEG